MLRRIVDLVIALSAWSVLACQESPYVWEQPQVGETTTLTFTRTANGDLRHCDEAGVCQDLPYEGSCHTILVQVNTQSGAACQTCVRDDGTKVSQGCDRTEIACVVVSVPEPDCVVCAHVNGVVVYSTCHAAAPAECDNDVPAGCQRCYDVMGRVIYDTCEDCGSVGCNQLACDPGFQLSRLPGSCCPQCVPVMACAEVSCPVEVAVPRCPAGMTLMRDPTNCCGHVCMASACPPRLGDAPTLERYSDCIGSECPPDQGMCPPGYASVSDYPYCGQCVLVGHANACVIDADCEPGSICAFDAVTCTCDDGAGGALPGGNTSACTASGDACAGVCRPSDPVCPNVGNPHDSAPSQAFCEGKFEVAYDSSGCPALICMCADGSMSLDGTCRDLCASVDCGNTPMLTCQPGEELQYGYPHCCGACVPTCPLVACALDYLPRVGPDGCYTCVPDWTSITPCLNTADCGPGAYCSVETGACYPDPYGNGCASDSTPECPNLCYGECVSLTTTSSRCVDSDAAVDLFTAGDATMTSSTGLATLVVDTCSVDGGSVIEAYCYHTASGDRVSTTVVACPNGVCSQGACL